MSVDVKVQDEAVELFTLDGDEYLYVVDDPSGTPTPSKVASREIASPANYWRRNRDFNVAWCANLSSSSKLAIGPALSSTGTETANAFATTNALTRRKRVTNTSATPAGSGAGYQLTLPTVYRGGATGYGGFRFLTRFAVSTMPASWRAFIGLAATGGAFANADPSSNVNMVGIGKDAADTAWQVMSNDASGTATKAAALNATNFPINSATAIFEVEFYCPPGNAPNITYWMRNISGVDANGNDTYSSTVTGTISSDLPVVDTPLCVHIWVNNGTSVTAVALDLLRFATEALGSN